MGGGDDGGAGFADDVHAVVIAGAVFAGGHEALGFVGPEDDEVVAGAFGFGFVEAAEGVVVEKEFEEGVHVAAFGLEALGQRDEDNFALIDGAEVEGAFAGAEDFGHFGGEEVLEVIANGFANAAKLFIGLIEEAIGEMVVNGGAAGRLEKAFEVFQFLFEEVAVG